MGFLEQLDNISVVDTKMFGFDKYMSAYLIKGKELALVDTGHPSKFGVVRSRIKERGFAVSDIGYIFVTHEHRDHLGNVAPLLRESPNASVYIHPLIVKELTNPASPSSMMASENFQSEHIARIGVMEPVSTSRIKPLKDGEVFDLGNGEKLRVIFTPGHQPGGIVLLEENNRGIFINDLVGNYFADCGAHYCLNSSKVNHIEGIKSLQKLTNLPVKYLYLGHYGIVENPNEVIKRAINNMEKLLDIGRKYIKEGKPELIAGKAYEAILPELEKLRQGRGEALYKYATEDHVGRQVNLFQRWCIENLKTS